MERLSERRQVWQWGFALCAACWCLATAIASDKASSDDALDLAKYDATIKSSHRAHWAFQPIRKPAIPGAKDPKWVRNPIDAFVLTKLQGRNWKPSPPAEARALLRRLYLNLIGLPPTLDEQQSFIRLVGRASLPTALDRVVDDLLARPTYGERWARHWLDLVRYAESNGYERDATKPFVWRYRDYVIRAFNDDKPFNQFIVEQLAGDELPRANAETLIATSYNRLGHWDDEPADFAEDRFDQLDDIVSTTSQVFLGLTIGCARCHNHKFEPLTMHDYYRMVAIFNPLQRPQAGRFELDLSVGTRAELANEKRQRAVISGIRLGTFASALSTTAVGNPASNVPLAFWPRLDGPRPSPDLPRGYFMHEPSPKPPATHLLRRGKASNPGPVLQPGVPTVLVASQPTFPPPGQYTTLRRLTLANWIARADNPLTARVMVNRIWQYHFGEGLVRTPSDFGANGERPTHPELLDWMADWFVQNGWSIKKLHRLIMTSNTYRTSKRWHPEYGAQDPENRLLWRMPYRRLEVEAIRDSVLAVSGQLNSKMYGPSMYPEIPKEALEGHSDPEDKVWKPFDERESSRRTIYAHLKRTMPVPMLDVMDLADTVHSCPKRPVTTVAPQAMSLFNGAFINRQSRHFAGRLRNEAGNDVQKQVDLAYRLALCRPPTETERAAMVEFLKRETENRGKEKMQEASRAALEQMCRVIFNLNEFAYSD